MPFIRISNNFSSNKNQNYDLRQTIPGEPGVDYPIHFSVPKTSFKCTGRHEGLIYLNILSQ